MLSITLPIVCTLSLLASTHGHFNGQQDEAQRVTIGKIKWHVDFEQALADAKKLKRPIWLHFGENPG